MKNLFFLALALPVLFLNSCKTEEEVQEVVIENRYKLDVPKSLKKATNLHADASLQYQDVANELYIIVIDEKIKDINDAITTYGLSSTYSQDLDGYTKLLQDDSQSRIKILSKSAIKKENINGNEARTMEMNAEIEKMDIYYNLAYIKGKKTYYQVMIWTANEKKATMKEKMQKMIHSFKEM